MNAARLLAATVLYILGAAGFHAHAYDVETHRDVTAAAVSRTVLELDPEYVRDIGLERGIRDGGQLFVNSEGRRATVFGLLLDGAEIEDDLWPVIRVRYHFFNPLNGEGLSSPVLSAQTSSPSWALMRRGASSDQQNSYWDARQYFFEALTTRERADRDAFYGRLFQTLGHVVHHIQDMAQPQHVRNDGHCSFILCAALGIYGPSLFESFTNRAPVRADLRDRLMAPALPGYDFSSPLFTSTFITPLSFWHTPAPGNGLAEYTNRNFVSEDTNFTSNTGGFGPNPRFPLPQPASTPATVDKRSIRDLMPGTSLTGDVWFVASQVTDNLLGRTDTNPRASSFSVFDEDLQRYAPGFGRMFTLNEFNIRAAHEFLIPRAVAYSAGMLDYFFRGRIDLRKDEQEPDRFRVVNLGRELISGRFALYYDAIDGKRYPVAVPANDISRDPAEPNAWRLTIGAVEEGNPNANLSLPISFVPPVNDGSPTSPRAPDEYMLVFSGQMGEERPDTGIIGAVAAKSVTAPYNGVLYVVGVDANGQRVALRWDKTGTRVVPANEFHPLRNVTMPPHYQALDKGYVTKQVVFKQHTFGWSYETVAATVGIHFPFYGNFPTGWVKNSDTGAFEIVGGVAWKAKSPDPAIGEFRFRPIVPENNPTTATLEYRRTYTDGTGARQTVTGNIPLPAPVGNWNYLLFPHGEVFVSGDGLSVSGFFRGIDTPGANPYSVTMEDYDLRITLAQVPTVAFVKAGERLIHTLGTQNVPFTSTVIGQLSVTACDPPSTGVGDIVRTQYAWDRTYMLDETHWIDYLNGQLRSYRRLENARQIFSHDSTAGSASAGVSPCHRVKFHAVGEDKDTMAVDGGFIFGNGSLVTQIRSNRSGHSFPGLPSANRTWQLDYEGAPPVPPIPYVSTAGPESAQSHWVYRAITDRVEDAVYEVQETGRLWFRSHDITDKVWYIGESSPLGEVFFATSDASIVVHEPKKGTPIVIPPNVVRLLAAVWM
jgi:hypothetical protein